MPGRRLGLVPGLSLLYPELILLLRGASSEVVMRKEVQTLSSHQPWVARLNFATRFSPAGNRTNIWLAAIYAGGDYARLRLHLRGLPEILWAI